MSNKKEKKRNTTKKVAKNKIIPTLKLDNDAEIPAVTTFMKNSRLFNISDIDINKIRLSKAKPFMKDDKSYKYHIFYEDDDKYIPLNICFNKTIAGYYNEYINEDEKGIESVSKRMNFVIDDDLAYKVIDIFEYTEKKLEIALNEFFLSKWRELLS